MKDNLVQLLLTEDEINQKISPFRLIFLSHCVYYFIDDGQENHQQLKEVIGKLESDLLAQDGIIVLFHSTLVPNSFAVMVAKFSFNRLKDITPTAEEYNQFSCDAVIRSVCHQLGLRCFELSYFSPLYLSQYLSQYADIFKDPNRYDELLSNDEALQDLYRLLFMAHRSPQDLYQDTSSTGLTNLVDQVIKMVGSDSYLNGRIAIQIIPSKNASQQFIQRLETIVDNINHSPLAK